MNRKITIIVLISLFFIHPVFADAIYEDEEILVEEIIVDEIVVEEDDPLLYPTMVILEEEEELDIPESIRNNRFYRESVRLTRLAHNTFEFGDYDASAGFAREAVHFAELSDEFVASELITEAKRLLDWADSDNIESRFPNEYTQGRNHYEESLVFHAGGEWNGAISSASRSIRIFAALEEGRPVVARPVEPTGISPLPSQYTVRSWTEHRDCLWNIAGYSWVYGDSHRWRTLFEANRARMPDPNNPNLIEPGMVLDIPSIRGETRQGMWEPNRTYGTP
jgi:hypothetical protein